MKIVKLNKGYEALVDDEDYERVNKYKWFVTSQGYAGRTQYSEKGWREGRKTIKMHRFILDPPEDREVDHINHNRLDNQKFNLRVCTKEENQYNAVLRKDNKSGYKGVYLKGDKWYTSIVYAGKQIYLGRFLTAKEGALAYNEAAKKYYGNFAKLNSDII